jgi:glycosyltransferase involved in cell wall biosynthesis
MEGLYFFPDVTLLITHYNRSNSLERLLSSFTNLNCTFGSIVVSDDGSKQEHIDRIEKLQSVYKFQVVKTAKNKGLGNNINKGQDQVKTKYTLYVQEDFEPADLFPSRLEHALQFMGERNDLDIIRFYAYFRYPTLKPMDKGFAEMVYSPWNMNHIKFYVYSDHPHLRRSNFFDKFGRYPEGIKSDLTEYKMAISFLQKGGKGLFYEEFNRLFYQKNSSEEPSMIGRANWRQGRNLPVRLLRSVYVKFRLVKNTWDLKFMR